MYREDIPLEKGNQKEWSETREEVKIYELKLPRSFNKIPTGVTEKWSLVGNRVEKLQILEVVEVWTNTKSTVKVAVLGKDKDYIVLSRNHRALGFLGLSHNRWDKDVPDVFENLRKGTWIVAKQRYQGSNSRTVSFITNEKTLQNAKTILDTLLYLWEKKRENSGYKWMEEASLKTYGTVTLQEVLTQKTIFDGALRRFRWIERKEHWDLWNAVKANITFSKSATKLKVKIKALDGQTYFIDCPVEEEKNIGWHEKSIYKLEYWVPLAYREDNDSFKRLSSASKTQAFVTGHLLPVLNRIPKTDFTFGINNRIVKVERRLTKNKAVLNFLNGQLVKADNMVEKLLKFLTLGEPISASPPQIKGTNKAPKQRIMSTEAKKLVDEGLNGVMRDLEGELPFHLNIVYKGQERKWYIEIAGKEFHVKGGYGALSKIKSAIKGTAIVNYDKYGYSRGNKRTRLIMDRLAELVGDKNSLWIVLHVKKMGALMKAIGSEK